MKKLIPILATLLLPLPGVAQTEVAFSLQGGQLTWFEVNNPSAQGTLSVSGLPSDFDGNALAYDSVANRLLFTSGPKNTDPIQRLYAVDLAGITLVAGGSVSAGAAQVLGNPNIPGEAVADLFGGGFYNGSYYALRNGGDSLVKVDFTVGGAIASKTLINLPGNNMMFLGDLAFDAMGNLWISGSTENNPTADNDLLWKYSTADGTNFSSLGTLAPDKTRYNGIFFGLEGEDLYGYQLQENASYGMIDKSTGNLTTLFNGSPFNAGGDLTNGFLIGVVPEPSGLLLFASGAGLGLLRRRRKPGH